MKSPDLSVVVPVFNEEESILPLIEGIRAALSDHEAWELVLVDDGSTDDTVRLAAHRAAADRRIRLLRLARNFGQTAAMQAGFDSARGAIVVSMDGDLQNDPTDIPRLVEKLREGFDLVAGYRVRRQDRLFTRRVPSWIANRLVRWLTGVPIRDNGCSLKAFRRELLKRVRLYSDMHRFIPAVAAATAGARIAEIPVKHHARQFGTSKYGLSRIAKVLADLLTIKMIRSFRNRPLQLFAVGALGAVLLAAGYATASMIAILNFGTEKAAAVVFPGSALLWLGLAFYLLMLGLVGEVTNWWQAGHEADEPPLVREGAA